jgi:hypothetical protein
MSSAELLLVGDKCGTAESTFVHRSRTIPRLSNRRWLEEFDENKSRQMPLDALDPLGRKDF